MYVNIVNIHIDIMKCFYQKIIIIKHNKKFNCFQLGNIKSTYFFFLIINEESKIILK